MRLYQHQTWQVWPEGWYGKSLLLLVSALGRGLKQSLVTLASHVTSFLIDIPVARDASMF